MKNACDKCTKECEYRNSPIKDYIITTTEHCCQLERNETQVLLNSDEFQTLLMMLDSMKSKSANLLKSQMGHIINVATNPMIHL